MEYGYDDDSHLTGITYKQGMSTLGTLTYGYDAVGQRTSVGGTYARTGLPPALGSATYDDANQIATFGGTSFTYDDNGNLTSDGTRSYTWNARNQLASLSGSVAGAFSYDALGRRRSATVGGATTEFLYDGMNPVQELTSGTPIANYLTGLSADEFFSRTDSSGGRSYMTDALGSTIALADNSGAVQTSYTYEPFGSTARSGATTANTVAFTGRESDLTGLYFYRARYYDPRLQRFLSEDPLGIDGGGASFYAYAANSPQRWTDPTGLCVPVPPVIVTCIPPAVVVTAEILAWLAGTYAAAGIGQELADLLADQVNQPAQASTLGGDDDAFSSDEAMAEAIRETREVLKDPNASAKDRSRAKKRLEELQRRKSNRAHGADQGQGGRGGGNGRQGGGGRGGGGGGGGRGGGRGGAGAAFPAGGSYCMATKKC